MKRVIFHSGILIKYVGWVGGGRCFGKALKNRFVDGWIAFTFNYLYDNVPFLLCWSEVQRLASPFVSYFVQYASIHIFFPGNFVDRL